MEDYNKVIESLGVRYFYDVGNNIILVHNGKLAFGDDQQVVEEGELLFIPGGRSTKIYYGSAETTKPISNDDLINNRDKFFRSNNDLDAIGEADESHSFVSFE